MKPLSPAASRVRANGFFALGLALLVGLGVGALLGDRQLERATDRRIQTYQVEAQLEAVRAALLEVETGLRGFALAGTPEFREPYAAGRRNVTPAPAAVRALTADNPVQQRNVAELETLAQERLALAHPAHRKRRSPCPTG